MKEISKKIQGELLPYGILLARKVGSGEVGILRARAEEKKIDASIYWNSTEDAVADLEAVIAYFKSDEG